MDTRSCCAVRAQHGLRCVARAALVALLVPWQVNAAAAQQGQQAPGPARWTLEGRPAVVVQDGLYLVVAAGRTASGGIVVANAGTAEIVRYSAQGREVARTGREGDGPGEFRWLSSMHVGPGDSVFAFDEGLQRLSVLDPALRYVRSERATAPARRQITAVGRLGGGRWFARQAESVLAPAPGRMLQDTVEYGLLDGALRWERPLARMAARITMSVAFMGTVLSSTAAFSPTPVHAVWGSCLAVSDGQAPEVIVFDAGGREVRRMNVGLAGSRVTSADVRKWVEAHVAQLSEEERGDATVLLTGAPRPDVMPAIGNMVVDAAGLLWVQRYEAPLGYGRHVVVVTVTGEPVAELTLPEPMRIFHVSQTEVTGLRWSQQGEESVVVYRLLGAGGRTPRTWPGCHG